MINLGSKEIFTDNDGWTVKTLDGKSSAHFENTIVILADGPQILTQRQA
jgi:methionyl aminopeptidase